MQTTVPLHQPQPVYGAFDPASRQQAIQNIIDPILRVHVATPTPTTPTRSFPEDNIVGGHNSEGELVLYTAPKGNFMRDCVDEAVFIGSNLVGVGSNGGMDFFISCYGRVGGIVQIPQATLRLVAAPRTPGCASLSLRYIDSATILHLLRRSVHCGRSLQLRPFRYDGSYRSDNPILAPGDVVLQVVYTDTGAVVGVLDDRIIPTGRVSLGFWP